MADECILAVNVGNTTTQMGVFLIDRARGGQPVLQTTFTFTTPQGITPDEVRLWIDRALHDTVGALAGGILASVVPALTTSWIDGLASRVPNRPLVVGPGLKSGIKLAIDNPAEVGADRIANAVAARCALGAPALAIGFGTTTTIDAVDGSGAFVGGVIAPGLALCAQAASTAAARLHAIDLAAPESAIGTNTASALRAGVVQGEAARADGLIDAIARELGVDPDAIPVAITGEHADRVHGLLRHRHIVSPALTLIGLALIWQGNRRRGR